MHALLLGIYANAVQSMTNELCLEAMNEDRSVLLSRYTAGVQYALHKAGFLQSSDLTTLQAYVLFLYSVSTIIDPRSYSCLTAIADRIAKRDALHRGIQGEQLSAFDLEIRRRTWWHIVLLDSRAAEVSGSGTFVVDCQWKVNLPLNVNESDLNPETTSLPREYERATDMLFCLIRCEAAEFHRKFRARRILEEGCGNLKVPPLSLQEKLDSIDVFERHIEAKYLQYCDPQLLLHDLSRYYATYFLTKMRIITYGAYLSRGPFENTKTKDDHQDNVIRICLEAIEAYHCRVQNLMSLKFAWYLANTPPFLAVVNLFYILRERTEGELVARAWDIMGCQDEIFGRPDWICSFGPEMHEAKQGNMVATFAGLVVQAWEARRKVLGRENQIPMPRLMNKMKEVLGPLFRTKQSTTLDKSNHEKISTSGQPNLGDATKNWNVSDAAPYSQPSIMSQPETGPPAEYAPSINSAPPYMLDMPVDAYQVDGSWVEGDEWPILFPDDGRGLNVDWDQILFSMYQ
ncbi:hypothetical protein N7462_008027 [Penicillium macrosclerotiorum]|uniref:uncharacterized protein n=1 Tax=Penicillium macrosclerotiorum TaxID=303699 RepID=UPI002546B0F8|nr:uncharacterized protein N7462_008027 [Penicillium macrosclerotiorum]KAJ5679783.1 hypothetical protein N7462_008027 [Penicillium macrosclerotiorum]